MEDNKSSDMQFSSLKKYIIVCTAILVVLEVTSFVWNSNRTNRHQDNESNQKKTDTIYIEKEVAKKTNNVYIENRMKSDSLQLKINNVLDSLNLFENKLLFMQENSSSSIDIIIKITDSINIYRKQTVSLKKQIEHLNDENQELLKKEREDNEFLKEKINYYEKRLWAIYAINLDVNTYSDGFDKNNKLVETFKAKKIKEMSISFQLSRELSEDENVLVEVVRGSQKYFVFNKLKPVNRVVTRIFKVPPATNLVPGTYNIIVYHNNKKNDTYRSVITKMEMSLE